MKRDKTEFKILKAFSGDCILIKTFTSKQEEFIILIDGGTQSTFQFFLRKELKDLLKIDLLVLTHIDSDHIGGLLNLFSSSFVDGLNIHEVWINYPELKSVSMSHKISYSQANNLKDLILKKKEKVKIKGISTSERFIKREGLLFTILSPTPKQLNLLCKNWKYTNEKALKMVKVASCLSSCDRTLEELSKLKFSPATTVERDFVNASSIAFILDCPDLRLLLLGDSRSEIVEKELREMRYSNSTPLCCDYVKIAHHGSKNNTSETFLAMLDTTKYIISTNGGSTSNKHPSREVISKIVFNPFRKKEKRISVFLNYPIQEIKKRTGDFICEKDLEKGNWNIECKNNF